MVSHRAAGAEFNEPESNVMLHQVNQAVASLPEAQQVVMVLVSVEGFSYQEAADILEVPIGTVMSRLSRARIAIGKRMLQERKVFESKQTGITSGIKAETRSDLRAGEQS